MTWVRKGFVFTMSNSLSHVLLSYWVSCTTLCLSLGFYLNPLLLGFFQTFWKWLLFPAHVPYWSIDIFSWLQFVSSSFSIYVSIMLNFLYSWIFVNTALSALCASSLFAQLCNCLLVMSLVFLIVVSSFIISVAIISSFFLLMNCFLPIELLIVTFICLNS